MNPPVKPTRRASRRLLCVVGLLAVASAPSDAEAVRAGAVRFMILPEASEVTFKATSRLMNADGRFHRLSGEVIVDPANVSTARVTVSIEAASIDTGIGMRDNHLRSEDFFDVRQFPMITFESERVEAMGRRMTVYGRLTVHGVTREVAVPVDVEWNDGAMIAGGEFVVNRREYGLTYQSIVNPIGNEVRIAFTFRARATPS